MGWHDGGVAPAFADAVRWCWTKPLKYAMGCACLFERGQDMTETPSTGAETGTPVLPDRLSVDQSSPYYNADLLVRGVGVRINGTEKTNVEEYCISEGWIRVPAGKARDRHGQPLTLKIKGDVEVWIKD